MYKLPWSVGASWMSIPGGGRYPAAIDTNCPRCGKLANLVAQDAVYDPNRDTTSVSVRCPGCQTLSYLWVVEGDDLYIHPSPEVLQRQPIEGADLMPAAVRQAYQDIIEVYNAGVWNATATMTRRTLEGIVNNLLPEEKGPLARQLEELGKSVDLARPLITLAHSVRQGGNIGAHFDLTRTTDRATAEAMVDLIEYLIEYIYTLPKRIEELDGRIDRLGNQDDTQES